ncbi:MAG TPA: TetR family transcriptional regulator C-terminal domain-containing protein [Actinoplanes sp.]|jgi:AcrR family transcriptional regulator|nr:TetR family transcriptional regulator C-terminal domain-containing protein [Actinoplanes sp.]
MHRFPNRQALLRHARGLLYETSRRRVEALEELAGSPREALRLVLRQGLAVDEETIGSVVWIGFLAAAFADDELIEIHRRNNRLWRERLERLVGGAAPEWPAERVSTVALALSAMVEGAAAFAAADAASYPSAAQVAMLDAVLMRTGWQRSPDQFRAQVSAGR